MVSHLSDEKLKKLRRGGHDPEKVYAAFHKAVHERDMPNRPTVVIATTIKGYGLGEVGEGRNVTHQQKKLNEDELRAFRSRFGIPISDEEVAKAPFYKPAEGSPEMKYLRERREALGGYVPTRPEKSPRLKTPGLDEYRPFIEKSSISRKHFFQKHLSLVYLWIVSTIFTTIIDVSVDLWLLRKVLFKWNKNQIKDL